MTYRTINSTNRRRHFLKKSVVGAIGLMGLPIFADGNSSKGLVKLNSSLSGDELFALVRKQLLLDKDLVYMNTGSLGPSPRMVVDKVTEAIHKLEKNPVTENWGALGRQMEEVRASAANFFNADLDEVILTRNTTEGLSLVGSSYQLNRGGEILTTNHEHGGGEVGLEFMAKRTGASIRKLEMPMPVKSKIQILDLIRSNISEKTKVLLLSHVVTITGLRMPIEEIANITKEKGILFIVDGAQAPGMLRVDFKELGADVYATSGHKWLCGPKETGVVLIRKEVQDKINPVFTTSGYGSYSASSGTRNVANFIGLGEAFSWHETIGREKIENRILDLSAYCREELQKVDGLEIISPSERELSTALVSVKLLEANNRETYLALREKGVVVKVLPKYNGLRFSNHMFNTREDIKKLVEQLKVVLNQ